jgi:hypothetical protein
MIVLELATLSLIPVLYDPQRFNWAARLTTALVFCLCFAFFISELWLSHQPRLKTGGGADSSLETPLTALTTLGLPCLWYAVFGRWKLTRRKRAAAAKIDTLRIDI